MDFFYTSTFGWEDKKKGDAFTDDPRYLRPDIRAIIVDLNGTKTAELMVVVPDLEYLNSKSKHNKGDNSFFEVDKKFSGTIQYYTWEGAFKRGFVFEKGNLSGVYNEVKTEKPVGGYRTCTWTYTTVVYNTYGSAWVGWDPYWYYNGSYVNGTNSYSEWTCVETSGDPYSQFYGGCQYGCGTNPTPTPTVTYSDDDMYDGIDPVELLKFPKFDCLYSKFIKGSSSLFNNTIGAFGKSSSIDLVFKDISTCSSCNQSADGQTITDFANNKINIYINTNREPLVIANTILHEGIHASVKSFVNSKGVDVSLINSTQLWQYWNYYDRNIYNVDHLYMVQNYINPLAQALSQMDGNRLSSDYYLYYAWTGMTGRTGLTLPSSYYTTMSDNKQYVSNTSTLCK